MIPPFPSIALIVRACLLGYRPSNSLIGTVIIGSVQLEELILQHKKEPVNLTIELFVSDEHTSYSRAIPAQKHLLCTRHFKKNNLSRVREFRTGASSPKMKRNLEEMEVYEK